MPYQTSHPEIMRGFSDPTEADIEKAMLDTQREREWYTDIPGFETNGDILGAYESGKLVKIGETALYRPATRFLNPDLHHVYPPVPVFCCALFTRRGGKKVATICRYTWCA